jgi:dipeptide/tripeptide permease
MWERFSYYGMRALLILFMTAPVAVGGLGFDTAAAGAIYGLYTSMVYMTSLPGGWIADRLIGPRRACSTAASSSPAATSAWRSSRWRPFTSASR